jgi:hypothetical protein
MRWPESLVREIVEKRCVIHAGSGFSSQSVDDGGNRPPSWEVLLNDLADSVLGDANNVALAKEFINERRYLDAAEVIRTKGRSADFNAKIRSAFIEPDYNTSESHRSLVGIAPKIIVTTNYDTLIEAALIDAAGNNSFIQYEHTREGILDGLRSPTQILVKMHGCAKYPAEIILSRSDYFRLRKLRAGFFDTVSALYKLNTILFLGCGIEDPDINLILENLSIQSDTSHPNYALVGSASYAVKVRETIKSQYNIDLIIYDQAHQKDFSGFEPAMIDLAEQVKIQKAKFGYP